MKWNGRESNPRPLDRKSVIPHHTCFLFFNTLFICTSVYYVLQSQRVTTGYSNNIIHKEAVKIDINPTTDIQNNTRGSAIAEEPREALRQLKYYGGFLTELLTRSSANPEEPCEHTVS